MQDPWRAYMCVARAWSGTATARGMTKEWEKRKDERESKSTEQWNKTESGHAKAWKREAGGRNEASYAVCGAHTRSLERMSVRKPRPIIRPSRLDGCAEGEGERGN